MNKISKIRPAWQFNVLIAALGIMFLILALTLSVSVYEYKITSPRLIMIMGLVTTIPIYLTFLAISRRNKQFADDEYLRLLLMRQTLFASLSAIGWTAIMGFYFANIPDFDPSQAYIGSVGFWYGMWLVSGIAIKFTDKLSG